MKFETKDKLYRRAGQFLQKNDFDEAAAVLRRVAVLFPEDSYCSLSLGGVYMAMARWKEAICCYRKGLKLDPFRGDEFTFCGECFLNIGDQRHAREMLLRAFELKPTLPRLLLRLHKLLERIEENEKAAALLSYGAEVWPNNAEINLVCGIYCYEQGRFDLSLEHLWKVVVSFPDHPAAYFHQGRCLMRLNRWNEAAEAFELTAALSPYVLTTYQHLGVCLMELDREEEARKAFALEEQREEGTELLILLPREGSTVSQASQGI